MDFCKFMYKRNLLKHKGKFADSKEELHYQFSETETKRETKTTMATEAAWAWTTSLGTAGMNRLQPLSVLEALLKVQMPGRERSAKLLIPVLSQDRMGQGSSPKENWVALLGRWHCSFLADNTNRCPHTLKPFCSGWGGCKEHFSQKAVGLGSDSLGVC